MKRTTIALILTILMGFLNLYWGRIDWTIHFATVSWMIVLAEYIVDKLQTKDKG